MTEHTANLIHLNFTSKSAHGITITNVGFGRFVVNGASDAETVILITDDIKIAAGTYSMGFIPSIPATTALQIIDYTSGSAGGQIATQTANKSTFTIDVPKTVRMRLHVNNGVTINNRLACPILTISDAWPEYFIPDCLPRDEVARMSAQSTAEQLNSYALIAKSSDNIEDLNEFTEVGSYILSSAIAYDNSPLEIKSPSMLIVFRTTNLATPYTVQILINFRDNLTYLRRRTGSSIATSTWENWASFTIPINRIETLISTAIDTYTAAIKNSQGEIFNPVSMTSKGENVGDIVTIMSYNVAVYHNDSSTFIPTEKLFNLKKLLYKTNADIIAIQEDNGYIDANNEKDSRNYIYHPQYPIKYGTGGVTIHSKREGFTGSILKYSTSPARAMRYEVFNINGKKLLVISTHPGLTEANRAIEYVELFEWILGKIPLELYSGGTYVSVPEFTHCVVCGDMNSLTDNDKSNLKSAAENATFTLGIGGYLGWLITNMRGNPSSIDNIIVSENVIINSIETLNSWYDDLYSDHVPVVANLTLL